MCNTFVNYLNNKAQGPRLDVHDATGVDPNDNLP